MRKIPARLHVLLASDSTEGLVIRRGPSRSVCFTRWDRKRDTFSLGQWMRGRIYERRSDLSPDGKHIIYFAMNGRWDGKAKGAWTAISRAPYMKAIALFPKGDCWHGGGLFTGKRTYWLNDGYGHATLLESSFLRRDLQFRPQQNFGGECPGVYYLRLQRDGWRFIEHRSNVRLDAVAVFEKKVRGDWILRKFAHEQVGAQPGRGCYWDEHELENSESKIRIACTDWEWADQDGSRLVWAANGMLFAGHLRQTGLHRESLLHDFNEMTFEAIRAPY